MYIICGTMLAGLTLNSEFIRSLSPGATGMKANTALGMMLSAVALALLSRKGAAKPDRVAASALAAAAAVLGMLTLSEYVLNWDLGIDQLLVHNPMPAAEAADAGRMSPSTALCLALAGSALFAASSRMIWHRWRHSALSALAAAVVVIGALALIG